MQFLHIGELPLCSGEVLPEVVLAIETFGRLDADGGNAILVTHGLTSGADMLAQSSVAGEGSWADLLKPGRALDAERYFIVCSNVIGSAFGSTGPASMKPGTDRHWGPDFPDLSISDMVEAQRKMLRAMGVSRLRCVVGPSYGGMQAMQWAIDHPDEVDCIGVVVSGLSWPPAMGVATLRALYETDPEWNEGWYVPGQGMRKTLQAQRYETLMEYGMKAILERRWPGRHEAVEQALVAMAVNWASRFDPNALLTLAAAGERLDVRQRLCEIQCPVLYVPSQSDTVLPPFPEFRDELENGISDVTYLELQTPYGHSASGVELHQWEGALEDMLSRTNERTKQAKAICT